MKKLVDLVKIVENNKECVILEITGSMLDLIKLGCFNGDEKLIRLTKGKDHTCTIWTTNNSRYDWYWGYSGYTLVSDAMDKKGTLIQKCIEQDFEIYIGTNAKRIQDTLHIKSLEDIKHNSHTIKMMYWKSNEICCHVDDEYYTYFKSLNDGFEHFKLKGYNIQAIQSYIAQTGCTVDVFYIEK